MASCHEYQKLFFDFDFPSPSFCRLKTWNCTSGHVKNRAKGDLGIERERSYSEPEDPYIDKPLADEYWLREYYQETKEVERINHTLENLFDGSEALET